MAQPGTRSSEDRCGCYHPAVRAPVLVGLLGYTCAANAAEVVQVRPWELHSSFWVSLHQTLIADAMRETPRALPMLCEPVEKHWFAYLKGQGTLETAIDNIVAAIPR